MIFVPTKAVTLSQLIKIIRLLGSSIISPSRLLNRKARKAAQRKFTSCVKQAKECFVNNDHSYPNLYNHNSLQTHIVQIAYSLNITFGGILNGN